MYNTLHYNFMVRKLRHFFQEKKGFIEVPTQSRLSILAACEQPETVTEFLLNSLTYPLPQTGQMWLEHELLNNPQWPGCFCITTSYRDEPVIIEGRHFRIFPMFEFEAPGDIDSLRSLEKELLTFLGFEEPVSIDYKSVCDRYETQHVHAEHEMALSKEIGQAISLEFFPQESQPFWNMKYRGNGLYNKIDVLLYGMETIGSAERATDVDHMRKQFFALSDGKYAQLLFKFGKERVMKELDEYLALPMFPRYGAGIGMTRLERAMVLAGLIPSEFTYQPSAPFVPAHISA